MVIPAPPDDARIESAKKLTFVVYILQAIGIFIGITAIVGVIINHVKKDDVTGTWLESHFRWQMRTFWFACLWYALGALTLLFGVGFFVIFGVSIWLIYRVVIGGLALHDGKEMYGK